MADPYLPTVEEIAELRRATAYATEAGRPPADVESDWVRRIAAKPDGGLYDVIDALAAMRVALEQLQRETQQDYVAIAAKQDRDAKRLAKVCRDYRDLHTACEQRVMELREAEAFADKAEVRVAELETVAIEVPAAHRRIAELETWKTKAETTLAFDKQYIDDLRETCEQWDTRYAELVTQRKRVTALAERWETATELGTGSPSIVTRSFAAEIRTALKGTSDV